MTPERAANRPMEHPTQDGKKLPVEPVDRVTIRFAGDSGDGMQLAGTQFTDTTALLGNDLATFPDYPAEIRAPAGTLAGVSAFQISFSSYDIHTPGDQPSVLVAMNPAALKVNLPDLEEGGILLVDADTFTQGNLSKAGYAKNPLTDGSLAGYRVIQVPITRLTTNAVTEVSGGGSMAAQSRNLFSLGIMYWLFDRDPIHTIRWIEGKFKNNPDLVAVNRAALQAGYNYAATAEIFTSHYSIKKAATPPGTYRKISGNEATALGIITAGKLTGLPLFYGAYPITPASDILHALAPLKNYGVLTFQAEDEIAAITACVGASFGGALAVCATAGPGLALKGEGIGLAVMVELPVIIAMIQRSGPSTGMPTKSEQSDLLMALYGRNGEAPAAVVAPSTPGDCFWTMIEAGRIATTYMTPTFFLSDGYLGNGVEPWAIPSLEELPDIRVTHRSDPEGYTPYVRDPRTLARPWAIPGTPGLEHRIGGLEKNDITGTVSYDPTNHQRMVDLRAQKIARIADSLPPSQVDGDSQGGDLLVVGWGSTYGAITSAVERARSEGRSVSHLHLRHLNPLPRDVGEILGRFDKVLVPELNTGQLRMLLRANYLVDAKGLNKVTGRPFMIREVYRGIISALEGTR